MGNCISSARNFLTNRNRDSELRSRTDTARNTTSSSSHKRSSANPQYTVFISHAGEDKDTIAIPLRQKLLEHGITAFVDEADMPFGTEAQPAMIEAMETAAVGVIVLSPEFVARKWPMKELMCFLRRREESIANSRTPPIVIPFFYRLKIDELYDEPRLDRRDEDGELLYHKSRFYERQAKEEPEANIGRIKEAMESVHGIMGLRNFVNACNEQSHEMYERRDMLLVKLCNHIRDAVRAESVAGTKEVKRRTQQIDVFHPYFDTPYEIDDLVFDFERKDSDGKASSQEGKLLKMVLDGSNERNRSIGVRGIGGVGKTSVLQGIRSLKEVRQEFVDGVYHILLGMDATRGHLIKALSVAVQRSGGEKKADEMRSECDVRRVIDVFRLWFAEKRCLFVIDDVWETNEIGARTVHELLRLHVSGRDSKVLLTTRSGEIASRANTCFSLEPRGPLNYGSLRILARYSRIEPEQHECDDEKVVKEILERCYGLPLFLAVAGKAVRAISIRHGHEKCEAYHIYAETLKANTGGLLTKDIGSYEGLCVRLMISVELLENRKKYFGFGVKNEVAVMHRRLCVVKKQMGVPMTMLKELWELETESEAADVAREFEQVGLADIEIVRSACGPVEVLRLHDSVYEFAVAEAKKHKEESRGHEALVRGYGKDLGTTEGCQEWWHNCIEADGYIHTNICRHLVGAGRGVEVICLLLCPEWAERQVKTRGIVAFEEDLYVANSTIREGMIETSDEGVCERRRALKLISEAVALSSGYIGSNVAQLYFQVHGRLMGFRENCRAIEKYVSWIETDTLRPKILCENKILEEAGGMSSRTISVGNPVLCITVMEGDGHVACGCADGLILVLDASRGVVEKRLKAHDAKVSAIVMSKDGTRIISGSTDHTAKVWDAHTSDCLMIFKGHRAEVIDISVIEVGRRVISVAKDECAVVWNMETGHILSRLTALHEQISCVTMLGNGVAVIGGNDGKLRKWNILTNEQVGDTFDGHEKGINCIAVTPDCQRIVSGSWDRTVRVWDVGSHQKMRTFSMRGNVTGVGVSDDGSRVVSCSWTTVQVWNLEFGTQACDALEGRTELVTGVSFLGRADRVVSSCWDGTLHLWNTTRENKSRRTSRHHEHIVSGVSFTPDGKFVVSASYDETLRIWSTESGQQVGHPLLGHSDCVTDVAVTPNGKFILSLSWKVLQVWDFESRRLLHTFTGHTNWVECVAVAPQGDRAVTGSHDKTVRVWDLAAMDGSHFMLDGHSADVKRVFFFDDGLRIISVDDEHNIFVWELETKKLEKCFRTQDAANLSRREILSVVGETTVHDDIALSIPLLGRRIVYGEGTDAKVLATVDHRIRSWALSPTKQTICLGLWDGQVAFLKLLT